MTVEQPSRPRLARRIAAIAALVTGLFALEWNAAQAAEKPAFPFPSHLDQFALLNRPFSAVFDAGGHLFNTTYNSLDGIGANLAGDPDVSVRFSRVPRPDLPGFLFDPLRTTGPNGQSCVSCHNVPLEGGAGGIESTGIRDPLKQGVPSQFLYRNSPHFFGVGALQRLAEEATADLFAIKANALAAAQSSGHAVTAQLVTRNGVRYGEITVSPGGAVNTSAVQGVFPDLVVRPYTWKGSQPFLRLLVAAGGANDIGLQPIEFFGPDTDFDHDGVSNELSVGDVTALTLYLAAQPRPVSRLELSEHLGGRYRLSPAHAASIRRGAATFARVGCTSCHVASLTVSDSIFREPSASPFHRYPMLPIGVDPAVFGLDPNRPIKFDLTANPTVGRDANRHLASFLQFESNGHGGAIVRLYGDLRLHDMGAGLADAVADEVGAPGSMWKTRELWGVGSTGPWLHDGRATTLDEAILLHGGEGQAARDGFAALGQGEKNDVLNFLQNLILFKPEHEDH